VLGPKPKKPVEEKSLTSALITGTKRKIQDILSYGRGHPESNPSSPKKRKVHVGNAATTKAQNAFAQSEAAREQAEREADEHSRQIASRENRALKRSVSEDASRRARFAKSRTTSSTTVKVTRHTTVSFKRKVPKSGALKAVKKPFTLRSGHRTTPSALDNKKRNQPSQRPGTPVQDSSATESSSDENGSPNITPASLRSASRKLTQFSPLKIESARGRSIRRGHPVTESKSRRSDLASSREHTHPEDAMKIRASQNRSRSTRGR
jgi:palmitoyltransferase ZDHHC9/14/18